MFSRRFPLGLLAVLCVIIAVAGAFVAGAKAQLQTEPVQVTVLSVDESSGTATLSITNRSGRTVAAWQISVYVDNKVVFAATEDLYDADRRFEADAETRLTIPRVVGASPQIKVAAVYEDRSTTGDEFGVQQIFERRGKHRDSLSTWVTQLRADLSRGASGPTSVRTTVDRALRDKTGTYGTRSLIETAARLVAPGAGPDSAQRLARLLARSEQKLQTAEIAATRR